jgi:sialic acid synthase SpsE
VKFQTFKAELIAANHAVKAEYQNRNIGCDGSQITMLKALELSDSDHHALLDASKKLNIEFMSTPFDVRSVDFLVHEIGVQRLKIGSGELTNALLLMKMAHTCIPVILSTGMASISEIEAALGVLAFGYLARNNAPPSIKGFASAFLDSQGKALLKKYVTLLHCTSDYPAAPSTINLRAMDHLESVFGLPVGLSDHSQGISVASAAVARGAKVIEKHFTLDSKSTGPDHSASLEPDQLQEMCQAIRTIELALGNGIKEPNQIENKTALVARKSLVAVSDIARGDKFSDKNLGIKRPGTGVSPMEYWSYLGRVSAEDYLPDALIKPQ